MEDIQTLTREKVKLDEPGLYDVIFLNDNITTTEFVVRVFVPAQAVTDTTATRLRNAREEITKLLLNF